MNKKNLLGFVFVIFSLLAMPAARAQSAFSNAVMNLNPVAYWPLQETAQPPAPDMEINLGSLGALGNAIYSSTNVAKGVAPIPGDSSDFAVGTSISANGSFLAVPTTGGAATLPAGPFAVEIWINPTNLIPGSTIIAQTGVAGSGGVSGGANSAGWSLNFGYVPSLTSSITNSVTFHVYNGVGSAGGAEASFSSTFAVGFWYHIVGIFDGTNASIAVNGVPGSSFVSISGTQALDTWDELTIGCGRGLSNNKFGGSIDEVAIYTNTLSSSQISAHYNAGSGGGNYKNTILADHPYMYWRMDAPAHTTPDPSTYPGAMNFGSGIGINGLYLPGTTPGSAGPSGPGFSSPSYACAVNGIGTDDTNSIPIYTNGVAYATNTAAETGIVITNLLSSMNLITNSVSFMCWFKENPADNRRNVLLGHGDKSWRTSMDGAGHVTANATGTQQPGDTSSTPLTYNDGNWHFMTMVYNNSYVPTNTGWLATNYMYVDGLLVSSVLITNGNATGSFTNIAIGCAPDHTRTGNGATYDNQVLAGSIAHVAYFTNALSAANVANLYTTATGQTPPAPVITGQPITGRTNSPGTGNNGSGPGSYIFMGVQSVGATSLQWYFNSSSNYAGATLLTTDNVKYFGTTTANMTVTNLVDSDSGYYFVVLANGYGSTTSILASFTVKNEPFITSQTPAAGTLQLYQNQNSTLSVAAAGETNFTYQWYTNGIADTTAGTGSTYSLTNVQPSMSGTTYQVVVNNSVGSATNGLVTLSVQPLPAAITGSPYATTLLALNPNAYFPMHETGPAAPGDIETNHGTLGSLGDGTFADWNVNNGSPGDQVVLHNVIGALTGDPDPAEQFNYRGTTNSYFLVPHTSPKTTLNVPFTIEAWVRGTGTGFGDIVSQDGTILNTSNGNNKYGVRLSWGGDIEVFLGTFTGPTKSPPVSLFQWHHAVLTCDTNNNTTNYILYVDGSQVSSVTSGFIPDSWDPLTIGNGLWNSNGVQRAAVNLSIDEVAIYNTNLDGGTIYTHYNDGINGTAGQYVTDVTSLNPILYYRMDRPGYSTPNISTWPVMTNYGSAGVNGVYSPGLAPGSVAGPNNGSGLFARSLSGTNAAPMNGMSTFAESFDTNTFNVVGPTTPLSFSMWFKSNPSDARYQTLVSQGPGWQLSQQVNGTLQFFLGSGFVNSQRVCNDGNWHQVVVTYSTNVGSIYLDGVLDSSSTSAALTNPPPTTVSTCIGCDVRFITPNQVTGAGRQYAGNICEMAFWKGTALTAAQVQTLYNSAGAPPMITSQPVSANVNANSLFTNSVKVTGSSPLSYQWYRDNLPLPIGGQTNLTIGATNASLVLNPAKGSDSSANYYVVITNSAGSVTSSVVSLTVFTQPVFTNEPILITQTNNIQLFAGAFPTFKVGTLGAQPTYYQWFTNGVPATAQGTNLMSYNLSVEPGLGSFYCVASNFIGMTTDTLISVTVLADPTAPYAQAVLGASPIGYWRLNEADNGAGNNNAGAIANDYLGGNNGIYTNTDLGFPGYSPATDPTTTSARFGFDTLADSDAYGISGIDFGAPTGSNVAFTVEAWVDGYPQTKDAGIVSKGYGNGGEQFDMDTGSHITVNSQTTYNFRFLIRDASGATHSVNSSVAPDPGAQVWHHLVGVCDEPHSNVTFYIDGVSVGNAAVAPGSGLLASTRAMLIGSRPSSSTTNVNDYNLVGYVNDVAVYNYALSADQIAQHYASAGRAPSLSKIPPASVSVDGFGSLTLPAGAVGTPPLSFTWLDTVNGTNVTTGSTNGNSLDATLTVTNVPLGWNGDQLELTVQNSYGSTNVFVTLTVFTNAPSLTSDLPAQVAVVTGKPYTYSISVVGPHPISYQWFNGSTLLGGQTNSTYSLVAGSPGSTTYFVVVTNNFGAVTSTISTFTSIAQLSGYAYETNVLALNPVGYWPLQETNAQAPATIETNYGTLGVLGNGYYVITNPPAVGFSQAGALVNSGDNDSGVIFSNYSPSTGQGYVVVPSTSKSLALNPPFTIECWANPVSGDTFGDVVGDRGTASNNPTAGVLTGTSIQWEHSPAQFSFYVGTGAGQTEVRETDTITPGGWHHVVVTCDASANFTLYVDGVNEATRSFPSYVPSLWNPLTIGASFWDWTKAQSPFRGYSGGVDEVAVYTNALAADRVLAHYVAGTSVTESNYVSAVQVDSPLLYYRMNGAYTNSSSGQYPEAVNYGSSAVNGVYLPGVRPGGLTGPTNSVLGTNALAAPINGVFSCVDAGLDPSFNASGSQSFSAATWFRTYPADSRVQTIMSHGVTNWAMNLDGTTGRLVWNLFSTGTQVTSTTTLNDGNWHFIAGVYDSAASKSYLYVDGQLNTSLTVTNLVNSEPNAHLYLGGNSDYTTVGVSQRYFAGALAQAAFFTNALSATQIQSLFAGAVVTPTISISRSGNNISIIYTGTLLSSTNVAGPYTQVQGASSPYPVPMTAPQTFYRTSQ
jgi:hypothetical protein